jgi:hypothetical protein
MATIAINEIRFFLNRILTIIIRVCFIIHYFDVSFILECSPGQYAYNCDKTCDGCLSDSCDKEHGVCTHTSGCKPGWQHGQPWKCDIGIKQHFIYFSSTSFYLIFINSKVTYQFSRKYS